MRFRRGHSYETYSVTTVALSPESRRVAPGGWDETGQACDLSEDGKNNE
ncbi:MAG TPA: hypothetical protein VFA09_00285 [Ktedonobacteraceae bacterium]|nr:hypothetical protein [Ktedonobacteraceae bacterium]